MLRWRCLPVVMTTFAGVATIPAAAAAGSPAAAPGAGSAPACRTHWDGVPVQYRAEGRSGFTAVSPDGGGGVWAVGYLDTGKPLIERGNAAGLRMSPVPDLPGKPIRLTAVAAAAADDAWAVGYQGYAHSPLALHWNGHGWAGVPLDPSAPSFGALTGVAAAAPGDAWAVGPSGAEHWDGTRWSVVAGAGTRLADVAMVSGSDVWAVGTTVPPGANQSRALVEHYDGTTWHPQPVPTLISGRLTSVTVAADGDVFAAGTARLLHPRGSTDLRAVVLRRLVNGEWRVTRPSGEVTDLAPGHGGNGRDVYAAIRSHQGVNQPATKQIQWGVKWGWRFFQFSHAGQFTGLTTLPDGSSWAVGAVSHGTHVSRPFAACTIL